MSNLKLSTYSESSWSCRSFKTIWGAEGDHYYLGRPLQKIKNNDLNNKITKAKNEYYQNNRKQNSAETKTLWKIIGDILGNKAKSSFSISDLVQEHSSIIDAKNV